MSLDNATIVSSAKETFRLKLGPILVLNRHSHVLLVSIAKMIYIPVKDPVGCRCVAKLKNMSIESTHAAYKPAVAFIRKEQTSPAFSIAYINTRKTFHHRLR
ncbi:hypothetical protein RF11_00622 [Thelohanellus kitauei]|uniref:Uncharacterized protein n=1 Tax=Thelohanellus kitauei TaxID=669202 RepID=A0A0C2MUF0_THEKT|nr:hypothetical protein RF11_00622 [Thelohanellus kitauei]